jgi:hypothetical protein
LVFDKASSAASASADVGEWLAIADARVDLLAGPRNAAKAVGCTDLWERSGE